MYHQALDEETLREMMAKWELERKLREARADPRHPDNDTMPTELVVWKRIKRPIYSKWWRFVHNLIAHPLMAVYRPVGEPFHDWTAKQMYKDNGSNPTVTDND